MASPDPDEGIGPRLAKNAGIMGSDTPHNTTGFEPRNVPLRTADPGPNHVAESEGSFLNDVKNK